MNKKRYSPMTGGLVIPATIFLLACSVPLESLSGLQAQTAPQHCPTQEPGPIQIGNGYIGPLPMAGATVAELRALCPAAYVEPVPTGHPGLTLHRIVFPFPGLEVAAIRGPRGAVDPSNPESRVFGWSIRGSNAVLPGGVPLAATWGVLADAYGEATGFRSGTSMSVEFCGLRGYRFTFDTGERAAAADMTPTGRDQIGAVLGRDAPLIKVNPTLPRPNVRRFCKSVGEEYGWLDATT